MIAGFENQHVFCSKYRVVGWQDIDVATYCTLRSALKFISDHPSAPFYRKRIFCDSYLNGYVCHTELVFTEPYEIS